MMPKGLRKKPSTNILLISCLGFAVAVFSAVASALNALPWHSGLAFFAYQALLIFAPGFAVLTALRFRFDSMVKACAIAYATGYCVNLILYLIIVPLGLARGPYGVILMWSFGAACAAYVVVKWRSQPVVAAQESRVHIMAFLGALVVVYVLRLLSDGFNTLLPVEDDGIYYMDTLYWIGNAVSLARGFPPESVRGAGHMLSYHYLSSMQLAIESVATGLSPVQFAFAYYYIQSCLLLVFGLYALFQGFCKRPIQILIGLTLVFFAEGFRDETSNYYTNHLFIAPFGMDVGLALLAPLCLLLIEQNRLPRLSWRHAVLFLLLCGSLMGVKSPVAILLYIFLAVLCVKWLFVEKKLLQAVLYGIGGLVIGFIVYRVFIMENATSWVKQTADDSGGLADIINWWGTVSYAPILQRWDGLVKQGLPFTLVSVLLGSHYLFFCNMAVLPIGLTRAARLIRRPSESSVVDWACLITGFAAFLLTMFLSYVGYSQAYFITCAVVFWAMLGVRIWDEKPASPKRSFSLRNTVFGLLILLTVANTINYCAPYIRDGVNAVAGQRPNMTSDLAVVYSENRVTPGEYEAYRWLNEHAEFDAILLTNLTIKYNNVLSTSCFAERRMYLESEKMPSVARAEADVRIAQINQWGLGSAAAQKAMMENGVNYFIIVKRAATGKESLVDTEIVFQNSDVTIYKAKTGA